MQTTTHKRLFSAEFERVQGDDRIRRMSLSSEAPYTRSNGNEILGHGSTEVRLERLRTAGPLLWMHDWDKHAGRIVNVELVDGKILIDVKFSRSQLGQEKMQDLDDGIIREVSVGYQVHKWERMDGESYRVTDWEPYEASLVTVPADITVGVGRSQEEIETPTEETPKIEIMSENTISHEDVLKQDRARVAKIEQIADAYTVDRNRVSEAVRNGEDPSDFAVYCVEKCKAKNAIDPNIGLSRKEKEVYSMGKVVRSLINPSKFALSGLELEAHEAASKRHAGSVQGLLVPFDMLFSRDLEAGTAGEGGNLVATQHRPDMFIDVLRNKSVALQAGARMLTGLTGDLLIPKKSATATWAWVDEEGALTNDAALAFGNITLSPKRTGATIAFSRQLALQSLPMIESIVRQDLADGLAVHIDASVFTGTGANDQPLGILGLAGRNTITFSGAATYAKVLSMISENMKDNSDSLNSVFVIDAATWDKWSSKERGASAAGNFILNDNELIRSRRVFVTEQIAASHRAIYGDFSQLMIGQWGGMELIAEPYTLAKTAQIQVTANLFMDVKCRYDQAFCVSTDTAAA
jgi:HK97 family phage major capsid protein/HK97 family phage prohead protease